jgi:ribosomal protein S18 acetylase RimI-like enzyme
MTTTVVPYESSQRAAVEAFIPKWKTNPICIHQRITSEGVAALSVSRLFAALDNSAQAWTAWDDSRLLGLIVLQGLAWDSRQLGLSAGRIDYFASDPDLQPYAVKNELLRRALEAAGEQKIQYLTARLDARDLSGVHVLEQSGFITVDGIVTFGRRAPSQPIEIQNQDITIRLATQADAEAAAEIARSAFIYDRFHADPAIPSDVADRLHFEWVRNSCSGVAADAVVLGFVGGELAGFVTCKIQSDSEKYLGEKIGTVVLVATREGYRGKGVAASLTAASVNWFATRGVTVIEVGTQLRNTPASRLYQRCGFEIVGASSSLRKFVER